MEIKDGIVNIVTKSNPSGFILSEPYVVYEKSDTLRRALGDSEFFVMGDNRAASSDSRAWGPVERKLVIGRALLRLFPIANASILPGGNY